MFYSSPMVIAGSLGFLKEQIPPICARGRKGEQKIILREQKKIISHVSIYLLN
jgi:hypothetical protein